MSESKLWDHVRGRIGGAWEAERVECRLPAEGFPDVFWSARGQHGLIELKYAPRMPDEGKILRVDHYTAEQRSFAVRHGRRGGRVFLLLQCQNTYWLFGPETANEIGHVTVANLRDMAIAEWQLHIDAEALLKLITR